VTSIEDSTFYGCTGLTSVTFEGTIASDNFNTHAFEELGNLRNAYFKSDGGIGTYTRPDSSSSTWTKTSD